MKVHQMNSVGSHLTVFRLLPTATLLAFLMFLSQTGLAGGQTGDVGNVYVLTNQPTGNRVVVFHRDAAGLLTSAGSFASGGNGVGSGPDPLGSQGAVVLSEDGRLLFAVNAGSNSISVFAVSGDQLALRGTVSSGGILPVGLAVQLDLVYVLNAGGTPNISGFTIDPATDQLVPLAGSTQALPGGAGADPAQVSFAPDGSVLVVTEKGTNLIDTFVLDADGVAQPGVSFPSEGATPFGFAFANNVVIVSEAFASALSSYEVDVSGNLVVVTSSLGDTQTTACWVVVPQNGQFAYTSNTQSHTISSYTVSPDGSLALLNAVAASTGEGSLPTDMDLSNSSRFLYVRNGNGTVSGFRVEANGSLTPVITIAAGLPDGAQGIAAR